MTIRNDAALSVYTHARPQPAMTRPPSAGPITDAIWDIMLFRLTAFARCSLGTRFGVSACRAGRSKAPAAELTAVST